MTTETFSDNNIAIYIPI